MPRPLRICLPNTLYHIYSRGNNREPIFLEEEDYQKFMENLKHYFFLLKYTFFAFCLMPNHFHLLLRTGDITLSKIMQVLLTSYTMYVNKKYSRTGHVFQGRYNSIIVDKDTYLLQVAAYIHLNPVKGGLVKLPEQYSWSSYQYYLKENYVFPGLNTSQVLEMFAQDKTKQKPLFQQFTYSRLEEDFDPLNVQIRGILAGKKYIQRLNWVLRQTKV